MSDQTGYGNDTGQAAAEELSLDTLRAVVELQRTELNRLLREQSRLNDRVDSLLRLHEREQVLRQQMQTSLDRLSAAQIAQGQIPGGQISGGQIPGEQIAGGQHAARPAHGNDQTATPMQVAELQSRLEQTESRFSALQDAVGSLVTHIEHHMPASAPAEGNAGFVRIYAPG